MPEGELLLDTDTNATLQQVMQQALSEGRPSAIIATGDLVHSGGTPVYQIFLKICLVWAEILVEGQHLLGQI